MELDQVVFEYGRLQLNFVACQRQNTLLGTQLAQVNKGNAAITKDLGKALARVTQLEAEISQHGLTLPTVPAEPEPTKSELEAADPGSGTDIGRGVAAAQTGPRGSRLVSIPKAAEPTTQK